MERREQESDEIRRLLSSYHNVDSSEINSFDDMPLSNRTKKGLRENGYFVPTDIQKECILIALQGRDILVLGSAKTGNGDDGKDFFEKEGLPNIIICTPDRLLQHMNDLNCAKLKLVILDEADRLPMTDMSSIINSIPEKRISLLFATQTREVEDLVRLCLVEPKVISLHEHEKHVTPILNKGKAGNNPDQAGSSLLSRDISQFDGDNRPINSAERHKKNSSPDSTNYDEDATPEIKLFSIVNSNASQDEKLAKIELLFEKNPELDIDFQGKDNDTSLHIAFRKKEFEVAKWLYEKGANAEIKNSNGINCRPDILELLNLKCTMTQQKRTRTDSEEDNSGGSCAKKQKISNPDDQLVDVNVESNSGPSSPKKSRFSDAISDKQFSHSVDINKSRPSNGLLRSYHGIAYQVSWMMIVALEAQKRFNDEKNGAFNFKTIDFKTEDPDAGKFDDLVWRYETDDSTLYEYNFLQAKHKLSEDEKITLEDLLKSKQKEDSSRSYGKDKRPFSLEKYFLSYRDEIKNNYNGNINKLIIATNIDFDNDLKSSFESLQENIPILNFIKGKKPENFTFKKEGDHSIKEKVITQLKSKYDSIKLVEELVGHIFRNEHVTEESPLAPYFYDLIKNKVIDITGKFHSNFINNNGLSDKAKSFRELLFQLGFKKEKENSSSDFILSDSETMAEIIVSKISKDTEVKITRQGKQGKIVNNNIDKLANYVLVKDAQNKVRFSRIFWEDETLPGNLNKFRDLLKIKLINSILINQNVVGSSIYENLKKYHFKITGKDQNTGEEFTTCKEILINEKAFWESMGSFDKFSVTPDRIEMIELANDHKSLSSEGIILEGGKFNESFKKGEDDKLSDKAKKFRELVLESGGFKNKNKNSSYDYKLSDPEKLAEIIALKINASKEEVKITRRGKQGIIVNANIDKLANFVLVKDAENKVRFSEKFWEVENLSEDLKKFRDSLKIKLKKSIAENGEDSNIYKKLLGYYFRIEGFNTCQSEEDFWEAMENGNIEMNINEILPYKDFPENSLSDIKNEIEEFLDRLTFVINYPLETLEEFIKQQCSWFVEFETDLIAYEFQAKIANALNLKSKDFLSTAEDVSRFFDNAKKQINSLILIGPTLEYVAMIEKFGITFGKDAVDNLDLNKFLTSDKQIFIVIADQNGLSSIKVYQILKGMPEFQKDGSYIFIRLRSLLLIQFRVLQAFDLENNNINLLVIECDSAMNDIKLLWPYLECILKKSSSKKIVFITTQNVLVILDSSKYEEKKDDKNSLTDLTGDSQQKLLEKAKVVFQGEEVSLGTLVDNESKHLVYGKILNNLISNNTIEIGKALLDSKYEDVKEYYIDRTFNCQLKLEEKLKRMRSKFLVTHSSQINKQELKENHDIVLINDTGEGFIELCDSHPMKNIHWFKKEQNELIWQKSNGDLSKLRKFVITSKQSNIDITDKVVIISAEPGMGKSTILTYLALKNKKSDPSLWIIRTNLLDYSNELKIVNEKKIIFNEVEAIKFLYRIANFKFFQKLEETAEERKQKIENVLNVLTVEGNKISLEGYEKKYQDLDWLEIVLFNKLYSQGMIALLFDGFDEISPNYEEKVIELLQVLKNTIVKKIWITTRPYNIIQKKLEDKLSVFSYSLQPLLPEEQKDFFRKFWKAKYKITEFDEQRTGVFIDELLLKFSKSIGHQDFMSIPLQAFMVAEVFKDEFKTFYYDSEQSEHKQKIDDLDLVSLYEEIIKIKFRLRWSSENTAKPGFDKMFEKFKEDHTKLALFRLFKLKKVKKFFSNSEINDVRKFIKTIEQGDEKSGIIERVINNKPKFIHQTFAEYFAACYFWEKFQSNDKIGKGFIKNVIKTLIRDDRIQICKFFQLKAQKDSERDFPHKKKKLNQLLIELVNNKYCYGPYAHENITQSTQFLIKIIDFFWSEEQESDEEMIKNVKNLNKDRKMALLSISAEMNWIKLVKVLTNYTNLDAKFLKSNLKDSQWFYNPVWLAAENGHLDAIKILVDKRCYDITWKDKDETILVQRIFQENAFSVLKSCLSSGIIDGKPYENSSRRQALPIVDALCSRATSDVVKLLLEKTDVNLFRSKTDFYEPKDMSRNLLQYDIEIIELAIKKGIDFSQGINSLLFGFNYEGFNRINHLIKDNLIKTSVYSDDLFNFFDRIKLLLKSGVAYNYAYNCKEMKYETTSLQYAKQIHYIHQLLARVHDLHYQKNDNSSSPLDTILKLIIDSVSSSNDFIGYKIILKSGKRSLLLNYKHKSLKYIKNISLLPENMAKLLIFNANIISSNKKLVTNTLKKLSSYISNRKEKIEQIKTFHNKTYDNLEYVTFQYCSRIRFAIIERDPQYEHLNEFVKSLVEQVLHLYIKQDYQINDALKEVSNKVSKFEKIINRLIEINKNSDCNKNVYNTEDILDILDLKSIDTNTELHDLISKIYECGGITILSQILTALNYVGQKRIMEILGLMFKFSDQSSKTFILLNKLDKLYNDLNNVIANGNHQEITNILQNDEGKDFIKAIINGQDDKYGSPLHYAALSGQLEAVKTLLTKGADVNAKTTEGGQTPLHLATENGHNGAVETLLDKGADINAMTTDGLTPLHSAAKNGQLEVVKIFLTKGVDVNAKTTEGGQTPLHLATENGHNGVVETLLDKGADINAMTTDGQTPLRSAAEKGHAEVVEALLSKGADVSTKTTDGQTPLHSAAKNGQLKVVKIFLTKGADINTRTTDGQTPLHLATENCHNGVVQTLLDKGADINAMTTDGQTPLHLAAEKGHAEVVEALLSKGADVCTKTTDGQTPLHLAAKNDSIGDVTTLLVSPESISNASVSKVVNALDKDNWTPLMWAAQSGKTSSAKILLENKAGPNVQNNNGETALHWAAKGGHEECVQLLLENNADPNTQNNNGETALHLATESDRSTCVKLLLEKQANPNIPNNNYETVLHYAAKGGNQKFVQLLLNKKVNPNIKSCNGETALHWAAKGGCQEFVQLLQRRQADPNIKLLSGETAINCEFLQLPIIKQANPNIQYNNDETALLWAAESRYPKCVRRLLLNKQTDPNIQSNDGETALHWAAKGGNQEFVQLFLNKKTNPNIKSCNGETALHWAAKSGNPICVHKLLKKLAKPEIQNKNGETALHWAAKSGNPICVYLLLNEQTNPNIQNNNDETAFHLAAKNGHQDCVVLLLDKKENPNIKNNNGDTALHLAAKGGHRRCVQLLLNGKADPTIQNNNGETAL